MWGTRAGLAASFVLASAIGFSARAEEAPSFAGPEVCGACHEERATGMAKTAHGDALSAPGRAPAETGCEACHGAGSAHAEEGGGKGVGHLESFAADRPATARSAPCLRCHGAARALHAFTSSAHAEIACTGCHDPHASRAEPLLRASPPALCYGCHAAVKAEFALPERHEVDRGAVRCMDCHAVHGSRDRAALSGANDRPCLKCHVEVQGPFVFEHVVNSTEGCTACHVPHGSANRHLLIRQQVAQLCLECHTVTPTSHAQPNYRDCTRCHASIHGSNIDPRFLEP